MIHHIRALSAHSKPKFRSTDTPEFGPPMRETLPSARCQKQTRERYPNYIIPEGGCNQFDHTQAGTGEMHMPCRKRPVRSIGCGGRSGVELGSSWGSSGWIFRCGVPTRDRCRTAIGGPPRDDPQCIEGWDALKTPERVLVATGNSTACLLDMRIGT